MQDTSETAQRESMEVDVLIVGGGPAGLATACRLMQLSEEHNHSLQVVILEKAAEIGGHTLSGAVIETRALDELFPDWATQGAPLLTPVSEDEFFFFSGPKRALRVPNSLLPRSMHNTGNYIVSLGKVVRWLGEFHEQLQRAALAGMDALPYFICACSFVRLTQREAPIRQMVGAIWRARPCAGAFADVVKAAQRDETVNPSLLLYKRSRIAVPAYESWLARAKHAWLARSWAGCGGRH